MSHPESLLAELRTALAHLHDPAYLENHPLAQRIEVVAQAPNQTRGEMLRRTLRLSIEALDPGPGIAPNAPAARPYQILRGRYILRQSLGEVAAQLDIGDRQAYRELRRAVEALTQIVWDSGVLEHGPKTPAAAEGLPAAAARLRAEVDRLAVVNSQEVNLPQLLEKAIENIRPLANEHGLQVHLRAKAPDLRVAVNRVMLRQAILNLLSHAARTHQGHELTVYLRRGTGQAVVEIIYNPEPTPPPVAGSAQPYAVAGQLLEALALAWQCEALPNGAERISVYIPLAHEHRVLIIDDNEGLIRLFERYMEGQPYRLFSATRAEQALTLVEEVAPEVIILDVMMPERDGWEVLEALRACEAGRRAHLLVCSIIDDPQLAAALRVDGFLHKPVDRLSLLQALERLTNPHALQSDPPQPSS